LAEEVEEIEVTKRTVAPTGTGNHRLCAKICMRCGGTGNAVRTCCNQPRLYCWVCEKNGTRTTGSLSSYSGGSEPETNNSKRRATKLWTGSRYLQKNESGGRKDTGASRSVIRKRRYHELREKGRWKKARTEITNGEKQKAWGEFSAMTRFAGIRVGFPIPNSKHRRNATRNGFSIKTADKTPVRQPGIRHHGAKEPAEEEIRRILETKRRQVFVTTHNIYMKDDKPIKQR